MSIRKGSTRGENSSRYSPERLAYLTDAERLAVLTVLEYSTAPSAAHVLRKHESTIKMQLLAARYKYGAQTFTHLVWLLYPALGEFYILPGDKR